MQEIENFKEFYRKTLKDSGIVGSSIMLLHDDEIIMQDFYGLAHKEKNISVDENTIYHWASNTKTLTGIAIMQLRDRGLLSLNDPVIDYLPELRKIHNPFGDMREITIKQLMSHTAGFRAPTWPWGGDKDWHPHEPKKWEQLVAMLPYTEIEFKPGTKFGYSNPGIIFLGQIIELLTGDDYEVYIDKNIFKPLEMYKSYFDITPYHLLPHRSHSYWIRDREIRSMPFDVDTGVTVSNGGLNATMTDMVKYINFLRGNVKNQSIYNQILSRKSLEEMWEPQIEFDDFAKPYFDVKDTMCLTFFVVNRFGQRFLGHSGGQNGFITWFGLHIEKPFSYLIAYNTVLSLKEGQKSPNTAIQEHLFAKIVPEI